MLTHTPRTLLLLALAALLTPGFRAQAPAPAPTPAPATTVPTPAPAGFDTTATAALNAMRLRANQLNVQGVAIVAYFEGDTIQSWSSKSLVIGRLLDPGSDTKKPSNLLAIAYSKASEMVDTLKDSGNTTRQPYTGEFGWKGGAIASTPHGHIVAAFSGGKSEDDFQVSQAGLTVLKSRL